MKKLMNLPENFVDESVKGIIAAYPDFYKTCQEDIRAVAVKDVAPGKVAIVTGGGYGHLPLFLGFVGSGLCDGVAVGNVFTSPSCETILNVSRSVDQGAGILYLFGNYTGDGMNFAMAKEMLSFEGIDAEIVKGCDDMASAPKEDWQSRRGIAGIIFAYKIAGACAAEQKPLSEVKRLAEKAIAGMSTFGVAFSSCILPDVGRPIFTFEHDDEMEIGMGIHGEAGVKRCRLMTSDALAEKLTGDLLADTGIRAGDEIAVLVNGLGATSKEELFIFYHDVSEKLAASGVKVYKVYVGEYATSMEMSGASLTLLKLDGELKHYLDAPAFSPFTSLY